MGITLIDATQSDASITLDTSRRGGDDPAVEPLAVERGLERLARWLDDRDRPPLHGVMRL